MGQTRKRLYGQGGGGGGGRRATRGYAPYQGDLEQENPQAGGESGGYDEEALMQMLQSMAERWRPQEQFSDKLAALDPVGWAIKQADAGNITRNANPWGAGGQFEGRRAADLYSPEEILASQGNTAQNQIWSARGNNPRLAAANDLYGRMWRGGQRRGAMNTPIRAV